MKGGERDEQGPRGPFDLPAVRIDDEGSVEQAERQEECEESATVVSLERTGGRGSHLRRVRIVHVFEEDVPVRLRAEDPIAR